MEIKNKTILVTASAKRLGKFIATDLIKKFTPPKRVRNQSWQQLGLRKSLQDKSFNGYLKSIRDTSYLVLKKEK